MSPSEPGAVSLRDVIDDDIPVFFDHQRDPVAVEMAAITSRNREDHLAKWREVRSDETITKTILLEDEVAGHIVSWEEDGCQNVGYAIGRSLWGRGIATAALSQFLEIVKYRPLYAHAATHNVGSLRVLEKCGFAVQSESDAGDVPEKILILRD
jgi:RimJ/RimL family protein N-acetyltransferase